MQIIRLPSLKWTKNPNLHNIDDKIHLKWNVSVVIEEEELYFIICIINIK